jgi:hypothetical protein
VSIFDVVVDRQNRQYFDILFDKPLGQGKVGEILDPAPAAIFPTLGGSWKWQDTNALRFEPSGGLPVASELKVEIDPEKVIQEGQVFTGETEVTVKTDKFLVEDVTVFEEPKAEGKVLRRVGHLRARMTEASADLSEDGWLPRWRRHGRSWKLDPSCRSRLL